jgi:hypothetical protein
MTIPGPLAQADAFDEMGADLPLSQMYAGVAAAGVAAEGIEPAAKKKKNKQAGGGGASAVTGDDVTLAGLTDTAEFLSQETSMLITTEEAVGEEVEEGLDRRIKPRVCDCWCFFFNLHQSVCMVSMALLKFSSSISGIVRVDVHALCFDFQAASCLPLVFGDKVLRSKVLFYCFCMQKLPPHFSLMTHPAFAFHVRYLSSSGFTS